MISSRVLLSIGFTKNATPNTKKPIWNYQIGGPESQRQLLDQLQLDKEENGGGYLVFNSLSWDRNEVINTPSGRVQVEVPALGFTVIDPRKKEWLSASGIGVANSTRNLENDMLRVEFNKHGYIQSIYDKQEQREIVAANETGNVFKLFQDVPITYEAWDVDLYYEETTPFLLELSSMDIIEQNDYFASASLQFYGPHCTLNQVIHLQKGSKRIDFNTTVAWSESQKMLRVEFPVNIKSDTATYEIQYGHVKRNTHDNTSWDMAQFEVVAHKWADLSQPNYGVALLNDCKYGHKIKGNVLSLNLLRSPKSPDEQADMHQHQFNYALFPHCGDHIDGMVIHQAYQFNHPLKATTCPLPEWPIKPYGPLELDSKQVIVESIKKAENQEAVVIRLYEATGGDALVNISFQRKINKVMLVNLMEEPSRELQTVENTLKISFRPFEIHTLMLFWE